MVVFSHLRAAAEGFDPGPLLWYSKDRCGSVLLIHMLQPVLPPEGGQVLLPTDEHDLMEGPGGLVFKPGRLLPGA